MKQLVQHLRLVVLLAFAGLPETALAEAPSFGPVFSSHMVVQRDQPLRLWGRVGGGSAVTVSLAGKSVNVMAGADGTWRATMPPIAAGGPFELVATAGSASTKLTDVLAGDVWLCSGQSNMQFAVKGAVGGREAILAAAGDRRLRLMTVPTIASSVPAERTETQWVTPADDAATAEFSAVALHFAQALHTSSPAAKDVPIGLINCSLGGSWVEYWIPAERPQPRGEIKPISLWTVKPTHLYNGMIAPLEGLNLKGVLWYQGESNAGRPGAYADLLRKMIAAWRADFQDPELPFYLVQLPNYSDTIEGYSFAWLREAQATVGRDDNVKLAVTLGTPDGDSLHPRYKGLIGGRLALLARRYTYGEDVMAEGPTLKTATPDGSKLKLTFDTHGSPITVPLAGLADFEVAGADGIYWSATAKTAGPDVVMVSSESVKEPKFARYAFSAAPGASLANAAGLPASPFRTDSVEPSPMMELMIAKPSRRFVTKRYSATVDSAGWLTGLMVDGHQMLSSNHQGGFIPLSGFGPFPLPNCTVLGPASVAFDDYNLKFTYRFEADGVFIDVRNSNKDGDMPVRLTLAGSVMRDGEFAAAKPVSFGFRNAKIIVEGLESFTKSADGGYDLQAKVKGGETKTFSLKLPAK